MNAAGGTGSAKRRRWRRSAAARRQAHSRFAAAGAGPRCGYGYGWAFAASLLLSACTVGPDYVRPSAPVPMTYKEAKGWTRGRPADAAPRGPWWSVYRDPVLDGLERQIDISNQNLKAAEAAFREAEAVVAQARAGFFPTAAISASAQRSRSGIGGRGGAGGLAGAGSGFISNNFSDSASASWTPDLWGRIRRTVEGDIANAQASAGDLAAARLSAQGELASDYMQLRITDELQRLLERSAKAYAESVRITRNQYKAGTAAASDVAQALTQLENTRAQAIAVAATRAQLEHAIAILIGKPPAEVTVAPALASPAVPAIPLDVPATLLQRRPDIAAAERAMAAANAQIGVAEAAFFPDVTLSGDYGHAASMLGKLFSASTKFWSFGADLAETVFDAGARHAQVAQARAVYDQTVANYRQTVLAAFQQVEDALARLRILAQQLKAAELAAKAARQAEQIITNQYRAGTIAYTAVVVAQTTALADEEAVLNIRQNLLTASVALIQALGGGWSTAALPTPAHIERDVPLDFSPLPPADAVRPR